MITPEEYSEILKKEGLQDMETEVGEGIREPEVPESSATIDMPQKPISGTVKEEAKT
jgi:hypothetical protein